MANKFFLRKQAGVYTDGLIGTISDYAASSVLGGLPLVGGIVHGAAKDVDHPVHELSSMNNDVATAIFPGVSTSRSVRRQRALSKLIGSDDNKHLWAHRIGSTMLNPLNYVATIPAAIAAGITPGHTVAERRKALSDKHAKLKTWLIPGYGTYQYYKDQGLANRLGNMPQWKAALSTIDPKTMYTTGGGALVGGLAGGLLSKENKLRNAVLGSLLGAGAGYATDYLRKRNPDFFNNVKDKLNASIR